VANVFSFTVNSPFLGLAGMGWDKMGVHSSLTPPFQMHVTDRGMGRMILSTSRRRMQTQSLREYQLQVGDLRAHMDQECLAAIAPCPQRYILGEQGGCPTRIARAGVGISDRHPDFLTNRFDFLPPFPFLSEDAIMEWAFPRFDTTPPDYRSIGQLLFR
jgi:hypothetical protein